MGAARYISTSAAYMAVLRDLLLAPQFTVGARGYPSHEIMNYMLTVTSPKSTPIITKSQKRNAVIIRYLEAEKALYLAGELHAEVWASKASKFWKSIANDDGTINSNYGWLALYNKSLPGGLTPWEWTKVSLEKDKESRQAYLRLALPQHQWIGNRDQVCTLHVMFMIRNSELHATTVMRSNDVVKGLIYDMPWFVYLQEKMAAELGVPVGTYSHLAHSMHLYDKDTGLARQMLYGENKPDDE